MLHQQELTGAGHVRKNDVDVDFQFVSSRRVNIKLRVDLHKQTARTDFKHGERQIHYDTSNHNAFSSMKSTKSTSSGTFVRT